MDVAVKVNAKVLIGLRPVIQGAELYRRAIIRTGGYRSYKGEKMERNNTYYTISQLSSKLKVSTPTLRYWEKEFTGILVPLRTKGGQRRYTQEHIAIIEQIHSLKEAGFSLAQIKQKIHAPSGGPHPDADGIDLLAERVAEAVKLEVQRFFKRGNS